MLKKSHLLLLACIFCSCGEDIQEYISEPSISITDVLTTDRENYTVLITPEDNAAEYTYAAIDKDSFTTNKLIQGQIPNQVKVSGNAQTQAVFSNLSDNDCIVAVAFDEKGNSGPIAMHAVRSIPQDIAVDTSFLTDCSLGLRISWPEEYSRCTYHFGNESDRDAFLNGDLVDSTLHDFTQSFFYVNEFDLDPNTEYILYVQGWDRKGALVETCEYSITTLEADSCPKAEMQVNYVDVYKADLTFKANSLTSTIITMPSWAAPEQGIDVRNRDILGAMDSYIANLLWGRVETEGTEQTRTELNSMYVDSAKYFYIEVLDSVGKPYLYRQSYRTPPYNENAVNGNISINITDTTTYGATYEISCDKNTFAFICGTVGADWYDEFKQTSEWNEYYLHEYLWSNGGKLIYKDDLMNGGVYLVRETRQTAGKRVYAVVCPMNENGYYYGFQPAILKEYWTKTRN